ncbi:MAG: AMP-binding protein, partial [Bdellovibrionales bacterium]|nr:AMP-binding protein [Bdellovibrionales bacterium]
IEAKRKFTYGDIYRVSNGLNSYFDKLGVQKGDRVAVFANNSVETILLFFALQRRGATLVPINFRLASSEVRYILEDCDPRIVFYDGMTKSVSEQLLGLRRFVPMEDLESAVAEALQCKEDRPFQTEGESPTLILYTSGTTGHPKGVVITPEILFWNSINTTMSLNVTAEDSMVSFLPLFHTGGWNVLLTPFIHRGASFVFLRGFDAEQIVQLVDSEQLSILFSVPTTLAMMVKTKAFQKAALSSLRFVIVGGEPMPLSLIKTWHGKGVPIRQGFGLTECGPNCFSLSHKDAERKIGSIGRPNFYVQVRIVNDEGEDVAKGQIGELLLKGPMCMKRYWHNDEATKNTFIDGWLKTGDLVKKDDEDYFFVVGRKKEMFISGGENVYPAEVEKVLGLHPEIDEVAVIGVPDPK